VTKRDILQNGMDGCGATSIVTSDTSMHN
jgi:hypothetical protein